MSTIIKLRASKFYEISPSTLVDAIEYRGKYYTYFRSYSGNVYSLCMVRVVTYISGSTMVLDRNMSRRVSSKKLIAELNALTGDRPAKYSTADSSFAL
jgi:hypothetical protein